VNHAIGGARFPSRLRYRGFHPGSNGHPQMPGTRPAARCRPSDRHGPRASERSTASQRCSPPSPEARSPSPMTLPGLTGFTPNPSWTKFLGQDIRDGVDGALCPGVDTRRPRGHSEYRRWFPIEETIRAESNLIRFGKSANQGSAAGDAFEPTTTAVPGPATGRTALPQNRRRRSPWGAALGSRKAVSGRDYGGCGKSTRPGSFKNPRNWRWRERDRDSSGMTSSDSDSRKPFARILRI
jgi:hypothetical protein